MATVWQEGEEIFERRRGGFGSVSTDTSPVSKSLRRSPVVGIPCVAAADVRTAGIRMEAGGDACWLTRRVKEVKRFVGLGQPLDSPQIELDSRPTRKMLADEPVADCVDPPAWCDVS